MKSTGTILLGTKKSKAPLFLRVMTVLFLLFAGLSAALPKVGFFSAHDMTQKKKWSHGKAADGSAEFASTPVSGILKKTEGEEFLLPDLVASIRRYESPIRPDKKQHGEYFSFANNEFDFLSYGESRYLTLTEMGIETSKNPTPLQLLLDANGREATLSLSIRTDEEKELFSVTKKVEIADFPPASTQNASSEFKAFCAEIQKLIAYSPDLFFQKYGEKRSAKEKHRIGISISELIEISQGDTFTMQYGAIIPIEKPKEAKCHLFRIGAIREGTIHLDAWDSSGKEFRVIPLAIKKEGPSELKAEEIFKNIRIKGKQRAVVKIGKKTKMLTPGEYMSLEKEGWKLIDTKEKLERVISLADPTPLFVFEGIIQSGKETLFSGTLFNATRSALTKVSLPVKGSRRMSKQKSTPPPIKKQPRGDEIPPELEELLEELEDL